MKIFGLLAGYIAFFLGIRLVFLSVVTFMLIQLPEYLGNNLLQRVGDIFRANEVLTFGIAAFLYIVVLHFLHPLTKTRFQSVFDFPEFKKHFAVNALHGLILTAVFIFGTMLGGHLGYLGIYMNFDEVLTSLFSAVVFGLSLFILAVVEEYIFRKVLEPALSEIFSPVFTLGISSAVYLAIKAIQFDMNWVGYLNFLLINLTLSMIALHEKSFLASASFFGTFMFLAHAFFGLPFMGQDMPGIFLLRGASDDGLGTLLSGGQSGPECALVLTILLVIYLYLPQIRQLKSRVSK